MTLQHLTFDCASCGFTFEAEAGSPASGVYYRAFWCPREKRALSMNVQAPDFEGRCAGCRGPVDLLADFPLTSCPRCYAPTGAGRALHVA